MNIRKFTFGKYKGQYVLYIIATHIGYVMWCLENIQWFNLNEEEQMFYDWQAIAIKKYDAPMLFPVETLFKHIKDKDSLSALRTPYKFDAVFNPCLPKDNVIASQLREAGVFTGGRPVERSGGGIGALCDLDRSLWKWDSCMRDEYPDLMQELDDMMCNPYSIVSH